MQFYYPLKPTRITLDSPLFQETSKSENFIAQKKKNGWRIQIHKENDKVEIYTRHKKRIEPLILEVEWGNIYRNLLESIKCQNCILDGEFLHRRSSIKEHIYLWDVFFLNNEEVKKPYVDRKRLLEENVSNGIRIEISKDYKFDFRSLWDSLEDDVDEGIVIKDITEPLYVSYDKTIKSHRQFKILRDDVRNNA